MKIFIDQSGKIEYTSRATIVAYSNGKDKSISISGKEKRKIQNIFRKAKKPDIFIYKTFAVLIYLLIKKDIKQIQTIIIDREYKGKESLIKKYLIEIIRRGGDKFDIRNIHFDEIGKKNNAHNKAINTYRNLLKPSLIVDSKELLEWIL
ncbi:hypothetical protein KA001_02920 [Patescibacteria group bacterium]|nr:hypothetical protein [Patescibacteria group bacterium]